MFNPFTAMDTLEDHGFLVVQIGRDKEGHRTTDGFLSRVAKKPLGPAVPTGDYAVEVLGKDRVVRRFYDRRVVLPGAVARYAFADCASSTERSSNDF